jgi:hypothetical protein
VVGIKAENIKDHTAEDYNTENTTEITVETRPEKYIISVIRKDIGLQNIIPKTTKLFMSNTINNLRI